MHSSKYYRLLYISCKICTYFGTIGMTFDPKTHLYQLDERARKRQFFSCLAVSLCIIFTSVKTYEIYDEEKVTQEFNLCYVFTFVGILLVGPLWNYFVEEDDFVMVLNQLLFYQEKFRANWMPHVPEKSKLSQFMDSLLFFTLLNNCCQPFSTFIFFISNSNLPIFFHNLYPADLAGGGGLYGAIGRGLYIVDFLVISWMSLTLWFMLLVACFSSVTYALPFFFLVVNELKWEQNGEAGRQTIPELRNSAKNIVIEFNSVRILNCGMMKFLGPMLTLVNLMIGQFCLFTNFVVIRRWNEMASFTKAYFILLSTMFQLVWGICLEVSGRIHKNVNTVSKSWKYFTLETPQESKYLRKMAKSCRPIGVGQDGIFIIKRISSMKFFRGIITGTFKALLTIGKS
ncbi:hypothetical protein Fcan01_25431 [Folsomia candida]|uniref:Odorant receptor n=1 Tax=Folsomia candida TaxID=158441 RepID=A0A226D4W7_FOLCA|nr:hypothetical protein Fcan01_25431 [Folsomia candida]